MRRFSRPALCNTDLRRASSDSRRSLYSARGANGVEVARYGLLRTRACIYGLLLNQSERSSASTWRQRSVTPPGVPGTLECLAHPCRACIPSLGVGACASDQTSPLNPQCHASSRAELRAEPRPPSEVMHDPEMALLVAVLAQRSEMAKLARGHAAPSQRGHY